MAYNNFGRLVSAILVVPSCLGQVSLETIGILDRPEAYQRKFVTDFLRDGNPTDFVDGYPKTSDHFGDFILLTKYKDWVVPLAETRIIEWLKERESKKQAIENVTGSIAHSGTIQALEFTARVFANQPDYRRWIRQAIYGGFGYPSFFTKWYYAIESQNPLILEVANEAIPKMLNLTDGMYSVWGEAMIDRYKHEPTTLEILKDPLVEFARAHGPEHPEVLRQKLAKGARDAYARRQSDGKKKGR